MALADMAVKRFRFISECLFTLPIHARSLVLGKTLPNFIAPRRVKLSIGSLSFSLDSLECESNIGVCFGDLEKVIIGLGFRAGYFGASID